MKTFKLFGFTITVQADSEIINEILDSYFVKNSKLQAVKDIKFYYEIGLKDAKEIMDPIGYSTIDGPEHILTRNQAYKHLKKEFSKLKRK